jgi:micrococcal nuclease
MYEYAAKIDRVVDGDTVDVTLDLGFSIRYQARVRLLGINAPESRTRDKAEKALGLAAKDYVIDWCEAQEVIKIQTSLDKRGKFGRVLGRVVGDEDGCLNDVLVDEGHAVIYDGGKR